MSKFQICCLNILPSNIEVPMRMNVRDDRVKILNYTIEATVNMETKTPTTQFCLLYSENMPNYICAASLADF